MSEIQFLNYSEETCIDRYAISNNLLPLNFDHAMSKSKSQRDQVEYSLTIEYCNVAILACLAILFVLEVSKENQVLMYAPPNEV